MTFQCLRLHLHGLDVTFHPSKEVAKLEYPVPNVMLSPSIKADSAVGIAWGMLKFLSFPGWSSPCCGSELEVERHIGSCLISFFQFEDCVTSLCVFCPWTTSRC